MGRDALAELSREQLIELALALAAEVAELKARAPSGFGGSFVDNQDALPPQLEVGAECYAGFSSSLYSRMSPG